MAMNRMSHFEVFIGTWNTTGEVLASQGAPATTLTATDVYEWLPGKHFIAHRADARFGNQPARSLEVMGFDLSSGTYVSRSYDDQGHSERFDLELSGRHWRIAGEAVRFNGRFDATGDELTGVWERKDDVSVWQPWMHLRLVRAGR